jgi:hypothetical protein
MDGSIQALCAAHGIVFGLTGGRSAIAFGSVMLNRRSQFAEWLSHRHRSCRIRGSLRNRAAGDREQPNHRRCRCARRRHWLWVWLQRDIGHRESDSGQQHHRHNKRRRRSCHWRRVREPSRQRECSHTRDSRGRHHRSVIRCWRGSSFRRQLGDRHRGSGEQSVGHGGGLGNVAALIFAGRSNLSLRTNERRNNIEAVSIALSNASLVAFVERAPVFNFTVANANAFATADFL